MSAALQLPPLCVLGPVRRSPQSKALAVLPGEPRPVKVRLRAQRPGEIADPDDRSPILEFRPRGSRHPFCVTLQRLYRAHLESGEVRQALLLVTKAARHAEDAGQLWFGHDWQPEPGPHPSKEP